MVHAVPYCVVHAVPYCVVHAVPYCVVHAVPYCVVHSIYCIAGDFSYNTRFMPVSISIAC